MTATEELRRLLDELRKLACDINEEEIRSHSVITLNQGRYNRQFRLDMNHDWLNAWHTEFERILQAVAATLGQRTCKDATSEDHTQAFTCSECGCWVAYDEYWETGIYVEGEGQAVHIHPHYCPNCGAKVVNG